MLWWHRHSAWPTSPLLLVVVELWSISQLLHLFHQSAGGICVWLYDACYLVFVYLPGSSMVLMSKCILYMFRVALIPRGCLRDGGKRNKQCGRGGMLHSQSPGHGTLRGRYWGWGDSVFNFDIDTDEKLLLWLLWFACKTLYSVMDFQRCVPISKETISFNTLLVCSSSIA